MGGLFQAVLDGIGSVVGTVLKWVEAVLTGGLSLLHTYIIEPIMHFLGFNDEKIIRTSVSISKVFEEDVLAKTKIRQILKYQQKGTGAVPFIAGFAGTGDKQFGRYYRHGKWDYLDYLPDAKISATSIPVQAITDVLKSIKGVDTYVVDVYAGTPTDEVWAKYQLQEKYDYHITEDFVTLDGTQYYKFGSVTYNPDGNNLLVRLNPINPLREELVETVDNSILNNQSVTVKTFKKTVITVESYDATHDKVTTTVYRIKNYYYNNTKIDTVTITDSTSPIIVAKPSTTQPNTTTTDLGQTTETQNLIKLITKRYTVLTRLDTGSVIKRTATTTISTTYQLASTPITHTPYIVISTNEYSQSASQRNIYVPTHGNVRLYWVQYTTTNDGRLFYWFYNPSSNQYASLSKTMEQILHFDMYPVVLLRNMFFNLTDYNQSSVNGKSRPPTITKRRYDDTVELLDTIGVSLHTLINGYSGNPDIGQVQDAFFMLGVCPHNSHWVVSIVLFEIFDFIYDRLPFIVDNSTYYAAFRENPYNAALVWTPSPTVYKKERIGSAGTCTHRIITSTFTIRTYSVQEVTNIGGNRVRVTRYTEKVMSDSYFGYISTNKSNIHTFVANNPEYRYDDEYGGDYYYYNNYRHEATDEEGYPIVESETNKSLVMTKQIDETTTKTLTIRNTSAFNIIRQGSDNGGVSLEIDNPNFLIPLPVEVVNRISILERTALLGESVYLVFYAYQEKVIKWYQTAAFMSFLKIVTIGISIVISIISFGTLAAPAMTLTAALWAILEAVMIAVALQLALYLISELVDDIGLKLALSVAAMAVAAWAGGAFSEGFTGQTAAALAEMSVKAIDIYSRDLMKQTQSIQAKMEAFNKEYEIRQNKFDEIMKGLNSGLTAGDVVGIQQSGDDFLSTNATLLSPSQFYELAINEYKNFDALYQGMYDSMVSKFVDYRLALGVQE